MSDIPKTLERTEQAISRRSFIGWMLVTMPVVQGLHVNLLLPTQQEALDDALLLALASAILPGELGAAGAKRSADELQAWARGYKVGAERNHGYGTARIQVTGASPVARWSAQLRSLDSDARAAHSASFAAIGVEQRRAIVRTQLERERATALPGDPAGAQHIALALLASFYASAEATDLCYEARIQRQMCRPLAESPRAPVQTGRGGAR